MLRHGPPEQGALAGHEVPDEERDVLAALAQRRDLDREHLEAVVEVGAQAPLGDGGLEVAVGGGDDAHVRLDRVRRAEALERPFLEDAQEPPLDVAREVADLVEEDRAAARDLEAPEPPLERAGEGAALVAEELALDERAGQRRAVDGDERAFRAGAAPVDRARDELLARAGLARQEDGGAGRGDLLDEVEDALQRGTPADDLVEALARRPGPRGGLRSRPRRGP